MSKKEEEKPARNDGSYALDMENKKMSVTTTTGQHSVLFEDIASTSYNLVKGGPSAELTNPPVLWGAIAAIFLGFIIGGDVAPFLVVGGIIALFFAFTNKEKEWENVTVETRGGKRVTYSVDVGEGKVDMNAIEEARRK